MFWKDFQGRPILANSVEFHGIALDSMDFQVLHGIPWKPIGFHGMPWISIEFHDVHRIPWNSKMFYAIRWNPMEFHRLPWNSMEFFGIPLHLFYAFQLNSN